MSKLENKIDYIINSLIDGLSYRDISKKLNTPLTTLHDYCSKPEHSARIFTALSISASTFDDKAEEVLLSISKDSNMIEMSRARELAQYYKWKAAKRNPKKYGDKIEVDQSGLIKHIILNIDPLDDSTDNSAQENLIS